MQTRSILLFSCEYFGPSLKVVKGHLIKSSNSSLDQLTTSPRLEFEILRNLIPTTMCWISLPCQKNSRVTLAAHLPNEFATDFAHRASIVPLTGHQAFVWSSLAHRNKLAPTINLYMYVVMLFIRFLTLFFLLTTIFFNLPPFTLSPNQAQYPPEFPFKFPINWLGGPA